MSTAALIVLLHTAVSLYSLAASPTLPSDLQDQARAVAKEAISFASNTLVENGAWMDQLTCNFVPSSGVQPTHLSAMTKDACVSACTPLRLAQSGGCFWQEASGVVTILD